MPTVILLVSTTRPRTICLGPTINSSHFSIDRGHWQMDISGLPQTIKIALMVAARSLSMLFFQAAAASMSSTYMFADREVMIPGSSFIPGLISQANAWTSLIPNGASCHLSKSNSSLCLFTRSPLVERTVIIFWIACQRASHKLAEVLEPNTWLVEMK